MGGLRVQIGDAVVAAVVDLQSYPVGKGSEEVAKMQAAGGPHSREDSLTGGKAGFLGVAGMGEFYRRVV